VSGSFVGGAIGATIGFFASGGNPYAVQAGYIIGAGVGASFDSLPDQQGPRLSDLSVQSSEYGKPIPIVYGTIGLAGNIIWASEIVEVRTDTETGGGKGGPSQTTTTYAYFGNFAVAVCEGEVDILRMWAGPDKRLIWDGESTTTEGGTVRVYTGSDSQLPDPLMESALGVGNVPAYRGTAYVVFENFPLANDGNRLPFLTIEVNSRIVGGFRSTKPPTYLGLATPEYYAATFYVLACFDPVNKNIWSSQVHASLSSSEINEISCNSDITQSKLSSVFFTPSDGYRALESMIFVAGSPNKIVISGSNFLSDFWIEINADTREFIQSYTGAYRGVHGIDQEIISPTGIRYQFRAWGWYTISNEGSPTLGTLYPAGTGVGSSVFIGSAVAMKDHFAVSLYGSASNTCVRSYATNALVWNFPYTVSASRNMAYDHDRERIVLVQGTATFALLDAITGASGLHTVANPSGADASPPAFAGWNLVQTSVVYASGYYIFGVGGDAVRGTTLWLVNPDTLVCDYTFTYDLKTKTSMLVGPLLVPSGGRRKGYLLAFDTDSVKRLQYRIAGSELSTVVADLSDRAGLTEGQYNTQALIDIVDGYAVARQTSVRGAIDALRPAYYFDAVESDGVIKYVKRGGAVAVVIPDDDLAAHEVGQDSPDPLMVTRQMESELPRAVYVNHLLAATEYSPSTKFASRLIGSSGDESTLDMPMVLSDTKAQEAAEVNLHVAWTQRLTYQFTLPLKYSYLEPTDVVVVKDKTMRIQKMTRTPQGVIKVDAVADAANFYQPNVVVTETPTSGKTIAVAGETYLELM
jgi:hypothetical protein